MLTYIIFVVSNVSVVPISCMFTFICVKRHLCIHVDILGQNVNRNERKMGSKNGQKLVYKSRSLVNFVRYFVAKTASKSDNN